MGRRTVLVVDDHRTVAELLRLAIDATPGLTCVATAYDVPTARRRALELSPDVVLCDLHLGEGRKSGLRLARVLADLDLRVAVLLLTGDAGGLHLDELRDSGASGLLAKNGDLELLLAAVERATRDQLDIDPVLLRSLTRPVSKAVPLSPREQEVLRWMGSGRDVAWIAKKLGIRPSTCRGYVKSLLVKLDAHTQLEAVVRAQALGLLDRAS